MSLYPLTFYRKSGPPGQSKGPVIWIREDMRGVEHIVQHELTHVKQWVALSALGILWALACFYTGQMQYTNIGLIALVLHPLLYATVPAFKLWCEVQAYRVQVQHGGDVYSCATCLAIDYGLKITSKQAIALLKK